MNYLFLIILHLIPQQNEPRMTREENVVIGNERYASYVLENPLRRKIRVTVSCGVDFEKEEVVMLPRSKETIFVNKTESSCYISNWERL